MKDITVTYYLSEHEYKRLERVTELFTLATGNQHTPEDTFRALMVLGAASDMESYFDFAENNFSANIKASA
jgi:hypothetical protein